MDLQVIAQHIETVFEVFLSKEKVNLVKGG